MLGVHSDYGSGTTNTTFTADPNVVSNAAGIVIPRGKDVQYRDLANSLAGKPYAGNYEVADTAYGKGTINKASVRASDFNIQINPATKEYDGTNAVVWTDPATGTV